MHCRLLAHDPIALREILGAFLMQIWADFISERKQVLVLVARGFQYATGTSWPTGNGPRCQLSMCCGTMRTKMKSGRN